MRREHIRDLKVKRSRAVSDPSDQWIGIIVFIDLGFETLKECRIVFAPINKSHELEFLACFCIIDNGLAEILQHIFGFGTNELWNLTATEICSESFEPKGRLVRGVEIWSVEQSADVGET